MRVENLQILYLCGGVSFVQQFLVNERLAWLTPWLMSALQLAVDHDDDGTTFDKYGQDRLGNFFPSGGSLSSGVSVLWIIGRKYFKIPCPDIT